MQYNNAAAVALNDAARASRQEEPFYETDIMTSEEDEDDIPPPVYGNIYGEIGNEEAGLGHWRLIQDSNEDGE